MHVCAFVCVQGTRLLHANRRAQRCAMNLQRLEKLQTKTLQARNAGTSTELAICSRPLPCMYTRAHFTHPHTHTTLIPTPRPHPHSHPHTPPPPPHHPQTYSHKPTSTPTHLHPLPPTTHLHPHHPQTYSHPPDSMNMNRIHMSSDTYSADGERWPARGVSGPHTRGLRLVKQKKLWI